VTDQHEVGWVSTWARSAFLGSSAPPFPLYADDGFQDQTIRQIMPVSVGGESVRIRLTNLKGSGPITFDEVTVALADGPSAKLRGHPNTVTFSGSTSVSMEAGAEALSDPVRMTVSDLSGLAISLFARQSTGPPTRSEWQFQLGRPHVGEVPEQAQPLALIASGNRTQQPDSTGFEPQPFEGFVACVDVLDPQCAGAIVVVGDSTTVGYPRFLAGRAARHSERMAVLNAGISGNRMLTTSPGRGEAGLVRFPHDALLTTAPRTIIGMWINDLGMSDYEAASQTGVNGTPPYVMRHVDATDLIQGWRQLILRAHSAGLQVLAGTTIPFKGAFYWAPEKDEQRLLLNDWIRTSGEPDGVVDFDAALRDLDDSSRIADKYHIGDFLHPNSAGSAAMADCIDLDSC